MKTKSEALALPNLITASRIVSAFIILLSVFTPHDIWAVRIFFIWGMISDKLDGLVARLTKQHTQLGLLLEPVADTLIVYLTLIYITFRLDFPGFIFISAIVVFVIGFVAHLYVYFIKNKWFANKLYLSELSICFTYIAGIFYLFQLPYRYETALFALCLSPPALIDYLWNLYRFWEKDNNVTK